MFILCYGVDIGVHVSLESIYKDKELKTTIRDLVRGSGRSCPPTGEATASGTKDQDHDAPKSQSEVPKMNLSEQLVSV